MIRTCDAPELCTAWSLLCRRLPDGRVIHLIPMLYNVRLTIATPADNAEGSYTDGWCYDRSRFVDALYAATTWLGVGDPSGPWKKHIKTGRRGPGAKTPDADDDAADIA